MKSAKISRPLTTVRIAYLNLQSKAGRTFALVAIVAVVAFSFVGGGILSDSLDNGMSNLEARLGADIAVVPQGGEAAYENIILTGAPVNFYFDQNIEYLLLSIPGVERATPQLYLATLAYAGCCTVMTQVIGIDHDTDFVITPWIAQFLYGGEIGHGEVIVGSEIIVDSTNILEFFGAPFQVVARLDRTGTSMDTTVYVNMESARDLAYLAQTFGFAFADIDVDSVISSVLIDVDPNYDKQLVEEFIRYYIPNVGIIASDGIITNVSSTLSLFTGIINTITIVAGALGTVILAMLFSLITGSRKKEFAVLRVLGATRKKLACIVLVEAIIIGLFGAVAGGIFAGMVILPFGRAIGMYMGMPLLLPDMINIIIILAYGMALSITIGALSCGYSAYRISRAETYATMREGE